MFDISKLEELNSRLMMFYDKDEYQILFDGDAYAVIEDNDQSIIGKSACILNGDGTKLMGTKFDFVIPMYKDNILQGYCLLTTDIYKEYKDNFYITEGTQTVAIHAKSIYKSIPILLKSLTVEIGKIEVARYRINRPDFIVKHNQKVYTCAFCDDTKMPIRLY